MDQLPSELVSHLCSLLDKSSLIAFRLTCSAFAALAEDYLFRDFEFLLYPNSHRLYQLDKLAAQNSIASRLKSLSFESGIQLEYADYRYWQAQVYHEKSSSWSTGGLSKGPSKEDYAKFHENLQARFTPNLSHRYDLYRWHLDQQAAFMASGQTREALIRILNVLGVSCPNLQFKMIMKEPQIKLEELEQFDPLVYDTEQPFDPDPRRRILNRRKNCLDHFSHFIQAACLSKYDLGDFTAIDMPHELLPEVWGHAFQDLKSLNLKINALPHSDWLGRTGMANIYINGRNQSAVALKGLLNSTSQLQHLSLELPEFQKAEFGFELFDRTNLDRFPRLWMPHLESLCLCNFQCRFGDMRALLNEGVNIKTLTLRNGRLETDSMVTLLNYLADKRLMSVSILGTWYVDEDSGEWHSHTLDDFTSCHAATSYEGPYAYSGIKSKIERFMSQGGNCPLPTWTVSNDAQIAWELAGDTSWHYCPGLPHQGHP